MEENDVEVRESLRPGRNEKIMDLVAEAGIDVAPWGVRKDGSVIDNPRTNQMYCYEWAFGGDGQPTALCIWHSSLTISQGSVLYDGNMRQYALELGRVATDRSVSSGVRYSARTKEKRARNFDSLVQRAYRKSQPVRVVILEGKRRSDPDLGWDTSQVRYRALDSESWYVHSYSYGDGSCRLVRKVPPDRIPTENDTLSLQPVFIDQFSLSAPVSKHESTGFIFDRSSEVRRAVLERAAGVCECCGVPGFKMNKGGIFLETHHVVPLSEKGPDEEWNVVAICPNDHRRAHLGEDRAALRRRLIEYLSAKYPFAEEAFRTLSNVDFDATAQS
jgi:5-methylcytosine-specific restriction protein A